jgi:hypothetical protein
MADVRPAAPDVAVSDSDFTAGVSFANRSTLNDRDVLSQIYTVTNSTSYDMVIQPVDSQVHSAKQVVDTAVRKNKVQETVTEQWQIRPYYVSTQNDLSYSYTLQGSYVAAPAAGIEDYCNTTLVRRVTPTVTTNSPVAHSSDTLPSPATTGWVNKANPLDVSCTHYWNPSRWDGGLNANGAHKNVMAAYVPGRTLYWQARNYSTYTQLAGYPKNVTDSYIVPVTASFGATSFAVLDDLGAVVDGVNGFYKIPAGKTYTIEKHVRTPLLVLRDQTDVSDLSTFSSYTMHKYDRELSWDIGRPLTLNLYHSDTPYALQNLNPTVNEVGTGSATYVLSR